MSFLFRLWTIFAVMEELRIITAMTFDLLFKAGFPSKQDL